MCELFALSSKIETTVSFSLQEFSEHGGHTGPHSDGWGLAFYHQTNADIYREPLPAASSEWMYFLRSNDILSSCVISHIRRATIGDVSLANTQPFFKSTPQRTHVFSHNGHLKDVQKAVPLKHSKVTGNTDSEYAFCCLMEALEPLWREGTPDLQQRRKVIEAVFKELATLGPANFIYADGDYLYAYANKRTQSDGKIAAPGMHYLLRHCDCDVETLKNAGVEIHCEPQDIVLFASVPLTGEDWRPVESCRLMVAKNGCLL